jgi:integrase
MVGFGKDRSENIENFRFLSYISESRIKDILASGLISETKTAIDTRSRAIILLLNETGCDVRELVNLKVKDVFEDKIIFAEKNHEATISKELYSAIKTLIIDRNLSENDYLISKKKPFSTKRIEQILEGISGLSPKKLKDSYAIRNIQSEKRAEFFVPSREDIIGKSRKISDKRLELVINLLADGFSVDEILGLETDKLENNERQDQTKNPTRNHTIYHTLFEKYEILCQEILREQKHRSRFLLSSRDKALTRRRIEQLLSDIGCTSKDIERIKILDILIRRALEETSGEERELYQKWIRERMLAVRRAGSLEVYRW